MSLKHRIVLEASPVCIRLGDSRPSRGIGIIVRATVVAPSLPKPHLDTRQLVPEGDCNLSQAEIILLFGSGLEKLDKFNVKIFSGILVAAAFQSEEFLTRCQVLSFLFERLDFSGELNLLTEAHVRSLFSRRFTTALVRGFSRVLAFGRHFDFIYVLYSLNANGASFERLLSGRSD